MIFTRRLRRWERSSPVKLQVKTTFSFSKLANNIEKIMEKHVERTGRVSVQGIKDAIDGGKFEKISEATRYVRKQGLSPASGMTATSSTKPLVHTGKLRRSIKWVARGVKGIAGEDYGLYHLKERKIKKNKFSTRMNFAGKTRPARDFVAAGLKEREKGVLKSFNAFRKDLRKAPKK